LEVSFLVDWDGLQPRVTGGLAAYNNEAVSGQAIRKGEPGNLGMEVLLSQNIPVHTTGTYSGTKVTDYDTESVTQGDTVINSDGWSSTALKQGDVITVAAVNAVNPKNRASTQVARDFVLTADKADTGGAMSIPVWPYLYSSGAYQTIDAVPGDGKTITVRGTSATQYAQNIGWHEEAFCLVMAELPTFPEVWGDRVSHKGFSIRVLCQYDINNDVRPCRLDVLYGVKTLRPDLAVRLTD
jgi:hypothetical protein